MSVADATLAIAMEYTMGDKAVTFVNGRMKQAGDTGTVDFDGNVNLGNANDDNVVFNGEVDSHIVPDDNDTYDLGSSTKKWRVGYFNEVNAKLRHINTAKYTESSADQKYVRWDAAGSNGTPGVNNKFIAPADGTLASVIIRATSVSNSTVIGFHKASDGNEDLNTTPVET